MSGIEDSGTPPEVPEEYAATYRDAYLRALAEQEGAAQAPEPVTIAPEPVDGLAPLGPVIAGSARARAVVPYLVGGALVLVLAIVLVAVLSSNGDSPSPTPGAGTGPSAPSHPTSRSPRSGSAPSGGQVTSRTEVPITRVRATCTAPPGVDSAGAKVVYAATNTVDHDPSTAWRCDGSAVGERLTFSLAPGSRIGAVAVIPGYAKTDPDSHADRYAENNRITKVRWSFSDGTTVEQTLDPDPHKRGLQVLEVPRTRADSVTLEVLAVARGPRNTTAISEVEVLKD
jgi:hypothetical protein